MLKVSRGKIQRPLKVVIYGSEGIGKTTFAAQFPEPLFIDTEGGTAHLDVMRVDRPVTWNELLDLVGYVVAEPDVCKTLVIDTADWAEQLCVDYVCRKNKVDSIEDFGYGKGYVKLMEEFSKLLGCLDAVIQSGRNVVVTAHAKMRKFEQPDEQGAYDRWEMKLTKQVAPLLKEWCDMLLFCNYETIVVTSETDKRAKKATGGKRVIHTTHHPCWDAKNRFGLPDKIPLDFKCIAHLFRQETTDANVSANTDASANADAKPVTSAKPATALDRLKAAMEQDGVTDAELRKVVAEKGKYGEDVPIEKYEARIIDGWVLKYWDRLKQMVEKNRAQ